MHPELFHIGDITIPTYGFMFSFSIMLGVILVYRRSFVEKIDENKFLILVLLGIIGIVVGSKVAHIVINWEWYWAVPKRFLNFRVGHVYYGGFIFGLGMPWIYSRIIKEPFLKIVDIWMTYTALGLGLHRAFGCTSAGCCFGKPTTSLWGITYPAAAPSFQLYGAVPLHPTQVYEALLCFFIFGTCLYWRKYRRKYYGELVTLYISIYAVGRFVIEYYRGDVVRGFYGPLSTSQWISVAMAVVVLVLVVFIKANKKALEVKY